MKRFLRSVSALCLALIMLVPTAFASSEDVPVGQDVVLTDEEIAAIFALNPNNPANNSDNTRASDLISFYSLGISLDGSTLYVVGKTTGTPYVVKCGFKEVIVQRRTSSSSAWSDYIVMEDLYWDTSIYNLGKTFTVPSGYQYRATCVHYAKKNFFSVQKINNISNTVTY